MKKSIYMRCCRFLWLVFALLPWLDVTGAQNPVEGAVFTEQAFIDWVMEHHPLTRKANLLDQRSTAAYMKARGALDPVIYGDYEDKSFDNKNYFNIGEVGLKVPTWYGVDVKMSYNWANGEFLNPYDNLPSSGQIVAGVEVPLLQGLLFDGRRAQIEAARLYEEVNSASRNLILNDLLIESLEAYWNWSFRSQVKDVYAYAVELAEERFDNVKQSYLQGDVPAIDTLESLIQIQNRILLLNKADMELQKTRAILSNYLWYDNLMPLELSESTRPQLITDQFLPYDVDAIEDILDDVTMTHPKIRKMNVRQRQLEVDERLKREMLKPKLNFNYNFLSNGIGFASESPSSSLISDVLTENYKWGINMKFPLRLRKERADLQLVKLEQEELVYELANAENTIKNKLRAIHQQILNTFRQMMITRDMVQNYQYLLDAENEKFRIGESSIFLLNTREQKLIEVKIKLQELETEYQQLIRKMEWAQGQLYNTGS